jgi:hypothetical protein
VKRAEASEAQDSALGAVTGAVGGLMTGGPLGAVVGGLAGAEEKDTQDSVDGSKSGQGPSAGPRDANGNPLYANGSGGPGGPSQKVKIEDLYVNRNVDAGSMVPSYSSHRQTTDAAHSQLARSHILKPSKAVVDDEQRRIDARAAEVRYNIARLKPVKR